MMKIKFEFDGVSYNEQPMHLVDILVDDDLSEEDREMINKELAQIAQEQSEFLGEVDSADL
jgi:hypothetical protein